MPQDNKKGYTMQMGGHSKVCESAFNQKDKNNAEKASGKKPILPGLQG
tara:strand:+ start:729 stop:872 length:144 start_codon:yes stop_codon:yes gene_type:complete